jgi:predicted nucleic acid-binding protein
MRLYLDANFVVYCIEGSPALKAFCLPLLKEIDNHPSGTLVASRLTLVEVLVKPMRLRDEIRTERFRGFFEGQDVDLVDISNAVVDRALDLRVHTKLKLIDALNVATAVEQRATSFPTGDKDIAELDRVETVRFELVPVN